MSETPASRGSIFFVLAGIFKRHAVHPLLVGGYAVISYAIQRMTFDIDFMMTADECARLEPDVLALGYSVFNRKDAFVQYKSCSSSGYRDLDFLLADRSTVEKLTSSGKTVSIAGEAFTVPSPLHLIAMKLHTLAQNPQRELKDLQDIVGLMRGSRIDPTEPEVRRIFEKYQAMRYYAKVVGYVGGEYGN